VLGLGCAYIHRCLLGLFIGNSRKKLQSDSDGLDGAIWSFRLDGGAVPDDRSVRERFGPESAGNEARESMSRRMQLVAVALAFVVAGLATACGGTTGKGPGGIGESGASLVSSEAVAYGSVDGDLGSSRWQQVDTLLKKFPVHDRLLAELR
jgi:hypothetical protein